MGYIARKQETGELFYSKGANKIAKHIKINATTVSRATEKAFPNFTEKVYNGFTIAKCKEIEAEDRGSNIKAVLNGRKFY